MRSAASRARTPRGVRARWRHRPAAQARGAASARPLRRRRGAFRPRSPAGGRRMAVHARATWWRCPSAAASSARHATPARAGRSPSSPTPRAPGARSRWPGGVCPRRYGRNARASARRRRSDLERVHVPSLVTAPLAELGLETFFAFDDDANDDDGSSSSSTDVDGERAARLGALVADESGGLPFERDAARVAATPTAKRTLARLRRDIQAARVLGGGGARARRAREPAASPPRRRRTASSTSAAFQDAHVNGLAPEDAEAAPRARSRGAFCSRARLASRASRRFALAARWSPFCALRPWRGTARRRRRLPRRPPRRPRAARDPRRRAPCSASA